MKHLVALALSICLAACAGSRFAPLEEMPVAFGESVGVGTLVASPRSVIEDSRCPVDVQCIQAGRLVVSTRIDGDGWSETVPLTLGEPYAIHDTTITLVSVRPDKHSERRRPRNEYRFVFEGG